MSEEKFARYYEQLDDAQLAAVLADRKDLVPGALAALDREVKKRKVTLPRTGTLDAFTGLTGSSFIVGRLQPVSPGVPKSALLG